MSILEHASLMTDEIRRVPLEELQIRKWKKNIPAGRWRLLIIKLICTILAVQCRKARWLSARRTRFCGCAEAMTAPATSRCCRISAQ